MSVCIHNAALHLCSIFNLATGVFYLEWIWMPLFKCVHKRPMRSNLFTSHVCYYIINKILPLHTQDLTSIRFLYKIGNISLKTDSIPHCSIFKSISSVSSAFHKISAAWCKTKSLVIAVLPPSKKETFSLFAFDSSVWSHWMKKAIACYFFSHTVFQNWKPRNKHFSGWIKQRLIKLIHGLSEEACKLKEFSIKSN